LESKCNNRSSSPSQTICCRELKPSDSRSLIDPDVIRDIIIGLSDGLTVPFALTAGLSSLGSSKLVYVGGLAELISGAISMGIGGYLSASAERAYYLYIHEQTAERVSLSCDGEMEREVFDVLGAVGVQESTARKVANELRQAEMTKRGDLRKLLIPDEDEGFFKGFLRRMARRPMNTPPPPTLEANPSHFTTSKRYNSLSGTFDSEEGEKGLTPFLLQFGEKLEETPESRAWISAITIALGYAVGGLLPMIPYFFIPVAQEALVWSVIVTAFVLLLFGGFKTYYTGAKLGWKGYAKGMIGTLGVGAVAAGASWMIVKTLEGGEE